MDLLTVFTPTFNRADKIRNLYLSLCAQNNKNFIWLVVDDGSSDETANLINSWIKDDKIKIKYIYQENGGKCSALKNGIGECDSEWFFCVDSDDILLENAIDILLSSMLKKDKDCIGSIFPMLGITTNFGWVPEFVNAVDIVDLRVKYNVKESAILLRTDLLKKVDIPIFIDEKFLSEEIIYIQLSKFGKFYVDNRAFYQAEYLSDGLTSNIFRVWVKNPKGTFLLLNMRYKYYQHYSFGVRMKERIKTILNYNALCMVTNEKILQETPDKFLSRALYLPSILWKKIRFSNKN
ncbi:Glycosyltransferase involved in cell wall bisynthesis [Streptococcus equinus]|uniref:glycosyltransferase family A protein n=1 Tax=Streptococcus equinus TaxID=1335 RepID=UPI00088224C1|nr:glycosyltransferase family 2 protein [Streptococcus equinus]SDQ28123.1 Glycosyltransferase involved in cell wall bisynthesis [Streptococcus equinus]